MNNPNTLRWSAFKEKLSSNAELFLQFLYGDHELVDPSYHITEIKQAPITSVDCGGKLNSWTEIIIQLWEPGSDGQERAMKVGKALSIIELVEKMLELDLDAEVKVEFGNSKFDTRQLFPSAIRIEGENLIVDLETDQVQCKAKGRNETCGTVKSSEIDNRISELVAAPQAALTGGCCGSALACC